MKIAIIGRSELLFESAELLKSAGHEIVCIVTAKAAPEYLKTELDFEGLASSLRVPFAATTKISSVHEMLQEAAAEVAVSVNYSGIIPKTVTDLFPLGVLNAHGGDLPRYRGNACQAWAIINGEERVGLCIHRMIGGELDNGDIIERDYLPIASSTNITEIWDWMQKRVPELYVSAVNKLNEDKSYVLEVQSTEPLDALRCYPRKPVDSRIDWTKSSVDILRLINASTSPYSGAYGIYKGEKIIILSAEIVDLKENYLAMPGQIARIDEAGACVVITGQGELKIKELSMKDRSLVPSEVIKSLRDRLE
ncbi:formyltransferase family protein [Alphaproteobacteria bacterium]|nr:formyltransferase family protein [Alphaproteobacteria bacterium]